MIFSEHMQPITHQNIFEEEDYFVWCGSLFKHSDTYYMVYSRWEKKLGFNAWVTDSKLCLAKSTDLFGEFKYVRVLFDYAAENGERIVMHNPAVLCQNGRIYLYFMYNQGTGDWWQHRNRQRIGVAYTDDPEKEWIRIPGPVVDISPEGIDSLMVSNPSATLRPDGSVLMIHKAVSKYGVMPKGGKVLCGVCEAPTPLGPFKKLNKPIFANPENDWSVEDPFIWYENGLYYALAKDFHGYFTGTPGQYATALFCSADGFDWQPAEHPLAYRNELHYADYTEPVELLERPQIYMENGKPAALVCACMPDQSKDRTFNVRIPLK